jgi:hypothetical protein
VVDRLKSFGIVTVLALIVWLFAESESLTEAEVPSRVDIAVGEGNRDKLLVRPVEFAEGRVTIEMRGSQAALNRASQLLQTPIRLTAGAPRGIPAIAGTHAVRTLDFVRAWPELAATGVTVDYVTPPQIRVEVQELRIVTLTPTAQITGIAIDGEVRFTPAEISVRMPSALADAADTPDAMPIAIAPTDQSQRLGPGAQELAIPVQLPEALRGRPGVTLITTEIKARFTVVDTNITERFTAVPVQVVAPPIELRDWIVEIAPEDAILQVDVRGPRAAIDQLKSSRLSLVAVISLRDVDFSSDATTKQLRFMVLRDGVTTPLPAGVEVLSEKTEVTVRATRRAEP